MTQEWFEFQFIRTRNASEAVWIPLRVIQTITKQKEYGDLGYREEFYGLGSLLVPFAEKENAQKLNWDILGISRGQESYFDKGTYYQCDEFKDYGITGVHPVIQQDLPGQREWHVHQDLIISLRLKREKDVWVCPDEGYIEVIKLSRTANGSPCFVEIRAEFLKDYLNARDMSLRTTWYRSRREVSVDGSHIKWTSKEEKLSDGLWTGNKSEIHKGGMSIGADMAVLHVSRTDVDSGSDIPKMGKATNESFNTERRILKAKGEQYCFIQGQLWRNEWIDKGDLSPRIKRDETPPVAFFTTDSNGKSESKETLLDGGRWLWFKPEVILALANRRGGGLSWYSSETAEVCLCNRKIHFGINDIGLINVYAKDIAYLPDWQQKIWAGYNLIPDGGLSLELQMSQVNARPATTQSPEEFLRIGILKLNDVFKQKFGVPLFKEHESFQDVLENTTRFRSLNEAGLLALAKDLARLTVDSIDVTFLHKNIELDKNARPPGSIKSLEKFLSKGIEAAKARSILTPLAGIYELRLGDAHLPGEGKIDQGKAMLNIEETLPHIHQGRELIRNVVNALSDLIDTFENWP